MGKLKSALPHGGEAAGKLLQRRARRAPKSRADRLLRSMYGPPQPLEGERFAAFMAMAQSDVEHVAKRARLSVPDAAELVRLGVSQSDVFKKLTQGEQARMMFAFYGIREKAAAQASLSEAMARHPAFRALPAREAWRLALDHQAWGDGKHHGLRFENEPGYMGGMFRGLTAMIQADLAGRRLDTGLLRELHDHGAAGVFARSTLTNAAGLLSDDGLELIGDLTSRPAAAQEPDLELPRHIHVLGQGFRDLAAVGFKLEAGKNMSEDGLREMLATYNPHRHDAAFRLFSATETDDEGAPLPAKAADDFSQQKLIQLVTPIQEHYEVSAAADDILRRHADHIEAAAPGDAKLRAIARCCQELERTHLFADGNARTVGFLVLNKLLLENGMPPAMLADPNRFDGFSANELVGEIKHGQATFQRFAAGSRGAVSPS
ncbi:Fic family protein [Trinickia terrae]|uniref:Fic family protein n=1 Tax=Trinickia terrae TaxID=2571161 RepID=UPI00146A9C92|nr:Fic family protein [Trinickia terrae]